MGNKNKIKTIIMIIILLILLTGCWDRIDIENRALIVGAAFDVADETEIVKFEEEIEDKDLLKKIKPKYKLSLEILNPKAFEVNTDEGGGGGSGEIKKSIVLSDEGRSLVQARHKISPKINRVPTASHLQLIIMSEEVAREGIWDPIDCFIRDPHCPRGATVHISEGPASDILETNLDMGESPSLFINEIIDNLMGDIRVVEKTVGETYFDMITKSGFIIPKIVRSDKSLEFSGAGVFREYKMVGWLNSVELEARQWICLPKKEEVQSGLITVSDPEDSNNIYVMEILGTDRKFKSRKSQDGINIIVEIDIICIIADAPHKRIISDKNIKEIEDEIDLTIEKMTAEIIKKAKHDFKTDMFDYNELIRENHPDFWKENGDNWHQVFANDIEVEVKAKSNIKRTGGLR
ncbi:MAG TPA: Ger(x)C family spore germination protein [Thermoanaerobacterales bacterium]|nr:Ger(x)C family spore germination protein [Thermoanaerobacterales bacterium]